MSSAFIPYLFFNMIKKIITEDKENVPGKLIQNRAKQPGKNLPNNLLRLFT